MVVSSREAAMQPSSGDPPSHMPTKAATERAACVAKKTHFFQQKKTPIQNESSTTSISISGDKFSSQRSFITKSAFFCFVLSAVVDVICCSVAVRTGPYLLAAD